MTQSVVIGLPLTAHAKNETTITISEIQLQRLPQHSDMDSNDGISFIVSIQAQVLIL